MIVTRSAGNGKVLYMGTDSAWRWRKGVEDTYHYRFWGQVVRWMSRPTGFAPVEHTPISWLLAAMGVGVLLSGVRDLLASRRLPTATTS